MRNFPRNALLLALLLLGSVASAAEPTLELFTRGRVEDAPGSGQFKPVYETIRWDPSKTAVIVCDMWARHWCDGACDRGAQMAPRMNQFITAAREQGALIVHAPSGGMKHYVDHPARKQAQNAPRAANLPEGIGGWCQQIEAEAKGIWPIDQSDGGCDDEPKCPMREMDVRQTPVLKIHDQDAITDSGVECWNLLQQRSIENVVMVGVHTNMCVIGRPFGLRNLVRFGKNVLLVRDLTDTMYNSRMAPRVSHIRGTELILEHIEKYVCRTITSSDLLDGPAARFQQDKRPQVTFIVSDDHYHADKTLPKFAQMLREKYGCHCTVAHGQGQADIPGLGELQSADVMVLYVRRLALPAEQLAAIRRYIDAGKPVVALRTASHAFAVHGDVPKGHAQWTNFDPEVLGGNYHGHGPDDIGSDIELAGEHPILTGIEPAKWHSTGSLYYVSPIDQQATVLTWGQAEDRREPTTWIRTHRGGRVFCSSLGHPDDFRQPQFRQLLVNAIFWAMDRPVPDVK